MGERGHSFVEERYSVARLISDVQNLYEELLNPAPGRLAGAEHEASNEISRVA